MLIGSRKYGSEPFQTVVLHGGPGAPGSVGPFAKELSSDRGVLEPFQSADSVEEQIEELKEYLIRYAQIPVVLIGHSWGAWLGYLVTSGNPELIRKLILVSAGPFEARYAHTLVQTRLNRLSAKEIESYNQIMDEWDRANEYRKVFLFKKLGKLMLKADSYNPIDLEDPTLVYQPDIFVKVWKEANYLRISGDLLAQGEKIKCPVIAIHGNYDPHPWEGIKEPLESVLECFKFILLKDCGHEPWNERYAYDEFYHVIREESKY